MAIIRTIKKIKERCNICAFCKQAAGKYFCQYWGFNVLASEGHVEQRVCSKCETDRIKALNTVRYTDYAEPLTSVSFPAELCTQHDFSNKRHTLKFETVCIGGVWYIGQDYQRRYDSMYGHGYAVGIYDGDYASERDAICARIKAIIKSETYYRCDEAVEYLKGLLFEQKQLTLF